MNEKLDFRGGAGRSGARLQRELARPDGAPAAGRIVRLLVGHGHGFIRLTDGRDVYFHRGDLLDGTPFNGLHVGDRVAFELLEDRFSGPRALHVRQQPGC